MRAVSLRLLLLVCVATLLRPDAAQAQGFATLTTRELVAALLVHMAPGPGAVPLSTQAATLPGPSTHLAVRPAIAVQSLALRRKHPLPLSPARRHTRYAARSSLSPAASLV